MINDKDFARLDPTQVNCSCSSCLLTTTLRFTTEQESRWRSGEYIQYVAPKLSPGERELLISGLCEKCFDELFAEDDE